jgi:hypothetical protein
MHIFRESAYITESAKLQELMTTEKDAQVGSLLFVNDTWLLRPLPSISFHENLSSRGGMSSPQDCGDIRQSHERLEFKSEHLDSNKVEWK